MSRPLQIGVCTGRASCGAKIMNYYTAYKIVLGGSYLRRALYKETMKQLATVKRTVLR